MNTKQLMVVAGLMLLATACKEEETVRPAYGAPAVSSPAPATNAVDETDPVYTSDGKGNPIRLKMPQETPTPKQDVMPTDLQSEM